MNSTKPIVIATRGSALALVQSNWVLAECRAAFPELQFELQIIKTTGDKMQTLSLNAPTQQVAKGLFTKELEVALLNGEADLAVHSLKDLPTELPHGLQLAAVTKREDVRDVLIYRSLELAASCSPAVVGLEPGACIDEFPSGSTIATSSTRRQAQLLEVRPDLKLVPIRGNVGTRLKKLATHPELDGLVLAAAGLNRLHYRIDADGRISGVDVPAGLLAVHLPVEQMLPCVGQAALGIETRAQDERIGRICERLNDPATLACVTAERAFLHGMGGGCLSPVAAYAELEGETLRMRAVSFRDEQIKRDELVAERSKAEWLGREMANRLK